MRQITKNILISIFAYAALFSHSASFAQETRQITVEATVVTFDGLPLEDVVLALNTGQERLAVKTDEGGLAQWEIELPVEQEDLLIELRGGGDDAFPRAEQLPLSLRLKSLSLQYHIDKFTRVPISQALDVYNVEITAQSPVRISGRLVDSSGVPVRASLMTTPGFVYPALSSSDDGSFTIKGVRRLGAAWLFVEIGRTRQLFSLRLTGR